MAALEVLTNEGSLAMDKATVGGPRLVIEGALVGLKSQISATETIAGYAALRAEDIATAWGVSSWESLPLVNVSTVPSRVVPNGDDIHLEPQDAIDIEFAWLPSETVTFDAIAVIARLYWGYAEYLAGTYTEGDIVWFRQGNGTIVYYRCTADVTVTNADTANPPSSDYWEQVQMTDTVIGTDPPLRAAEDDPVLLYICTMAQPATVGDSLELSYKLRLYITNQNYARASTSTYPIYLESALGGSGSAEQLGFLAEMAQSMQQMREIIAQTANQGA